MEILHHCQVFFIFDAMNYPAASNGPKVTKHRDRGRRKRRGTFGPSELSEALEDDGFRLS
jgi:hypothetical protein